MDEERAAGVGRVVVVLSALAESAAVGLLGFNGFFSSANRSAAGGGLAAAVVAAGVARLSLAGLSVLANGWTMGSEGFAAVTITGRATATAGLVDSTGIAFVAGLSGLA